MLYLPPLELTTSAAIFFSVIPHRRKDSMHSPNLSKPWSQVRVRSRPSKNIRVEFRFTPEYARAAWTRPQHSTLSRVTRGERPSESETLLLDDVMLIDNQSAFVRAWLVPADTTGFYHVRVELVAPQRIVRNARVSLQWDGHEYSGFMRAGQLFFENISPPNFSRFLKNLPSSRLRLSFEFDHAEQTGKSKRHENGTGNGHKNGNGKH